jgi:type I restriction enzyme S subunit
MNKILNTKLSIDKSTWNKVKLGDVVTEPRDTVKDFTQEQIDHVVGLEHIDSEDIHLRRSANMDDSTTTFTKKFSSGDVLFGRRRAYLKKAAQATFSGICSGDITVMRAKNGLLPELLPFVINNEKFFDYAITHSAGGLSPRVKFKDLANYEFLLPPKDQQAKLAELLWAMDEVVEKELRLKEVLKSTRQNLFENRVNYADGELVALSDVLEIKNLKSSIPHSRTRYIGLENIESGAFYCNDYSDSSSVKAQCNSVDKGDLCYSKLRPYLDKAFIASFDAVSSTELLVYKTNRISKEYVLYYLHSKPFIDYVSGKGFGTKMPRVNHEIIGEFTIKIIKDELGLLEELAKFQKSEYELTVKIESSKSLQKSLINQIF